MSIVIPTDIRQTTEYTNYITHLGWKVEKIRSNYFFVKKIPLLGYFVKLQRPSKLSYGDIIKLSKKYKIFQFIIEPVNEKDAKKIIEGKFQRTKSTYLPSSTVILNIAKPKKEIYENFKKDARYAIRKTKDIKVQEEKDASKFFRYWRKSVPWSRYVMRTTEIQSLQDSFKENCILLVSEDHNAGAIFLKTKDCAYYWQAFTAPSARKQLVQYKIVWSGILWAKNPPAGGKAKYFDLEGIEDERIPRKSWRGFSHFKKSFGGEIVYYPGTFVKTKLWGR